MIQNESVIEKLLLTRSFDEAWDTYQIEVGEHLEQATPFQELIIMSNNKNCILKKIDLEDKEDNKTEELRDYIDYLLMNKICSLCNNKIKDETFSRCCECMDFFCKKCYYDCGVCYNCNSYSDSNEDTKTGLMLITKPK